MKPSPFSKAAIARQPNVANWHLNLCALYRGKNRLDDALRAGREGVRHSPETANHRVELALTHLTRGELDEASRNFREAIGREPENAAAHMGMGELLLAQGDYASGWLEYAWRNKLDQARGTLPRMTAAPWNGMRIPDGKILLVADQGFGDMIQFARYIPLVRERVPHLIIGWGPEVTALLGEHPDIETCIARWADVPPHDAYVLLSTLPQIFGTTLETIPWPGPYMTMKPERVTHWRNRLDGACKPGRKRVGIAWSGRPTHPNNARRSIRLETMGAHPGQSGDRLRRPAKALPRGGPRLRRHPAQSAQYQRGAGELRRNRRGHRRAGPRSGRRYRHQPSRWRHRQTCLGAGALACRLAVAHRSGGECLVSLAAAVQAAKLQ